MTRIARGLLALALAAGATLSAGARVGGAVDANQTPQAPVFRSGTELVEVYAIVQDSDGKFVSGLTADDFALLEDEQSHDIQLFYLVNGPVRRLPREAMPTLDAQSRLDVFREWPRLESEFEALRIESGDARHLQEAIQRNCDERPEECARVGVIEQIENELQWNARRYLDEARIAAHRVVQTLAVVTQGLGRMEGRKTVMLVTEGFFVEDSRGALAQIAARAARFGISIYSIDARGVARTSTGASDASQAGPRIAPGVFDTIEDGPFILAADTGGFVIHNTNEFEKAFERVADDTSTYYVLGYTPTNASLDGTFRKIDVTVKWKGMTVRARKGYLATPLPPRARRYSGSPGGSSNRKAGGWRPAASRRAVSRRSRVVGRFQSV